jgi:hypothetical protein
VKTDSKVTAKAKEDEGCIGLFNFPIQLWTNFLFKRSKLSSFINVAFKNI